MDKRTIVYGITETLFRHLGEHADPEQVKAMVRDLLQVIPLDGGTVTAPQSDSNHTAIITVFGKSRPGIVAGITGVLAAENVDITDITQTLLGRNFAMIIIVNLDGASCNFTELKAKLEQKSGELGVSLFSQHEGLFQSMHKV